MATTVQLAVEPREKTGTSESRRLRRRGLIPGNLYGHGQEAVTLTVPEDVLTPMVYSGSRVVDIELNGKSEMAMLRDVQWDTFGRHILHFDLIRVSRDEKVQLEIAVELKGSSPGVVSGGLLDHRLHTISIICPAFSIPDQVVVRINGLDVGDAIHVRDLDLPSDVEVQNDPDVVIVQINAPVEIEEEEEGLGEGLVQPEVIGREEKEEKEE